MRVALASIAVLAAGVGGLAGLFVAATALGSPPDGYASGAPTISDVRVTNVRDTSFTVSWVTSGEATGHIIYATSPSTLTETVYDVRGPSVEDDTHYVTVAQLTDETPFYFDVVSGGTTDENGGAHHTVTTGPILTATAGSDTVYGRVWLADGFTQAAGTIVYITLADADGSGDPGAAAPMSALVEPNGWWSANLGNARQADLEDYFDYSESGDALQLFADGGAEGTGELMVDTDGDTPADDLILGGQPPTNTPTPSDTPAPSHTPTATPTDTPTATATDTPTPANTPTPTSHSGVYLPLVLADSGG